MPMPFWGKLGIAAMALTLASTGNARPLPHGRSTPNSHTIEIDDGARKVRVGVTLDSSLINFSDEHEVRVLGQHGRTILLVDSYASRMQGLSRCQSGHERYVRLIDLDRQRELFAKLAESCSRNIEPGEPIAAWNADGHSFTITMLSGGSRIYQVDADGHVR